jgi:hypothetical protein
MVAPIKEGEPSPCLSRTSATVEGEPSPSLSRTPMTMRGNDGGGGGSNHKRPLELQEEGHICRI